MRRRSLLAVLGSVAVLLLGITQSTIANAGELKLPRNRVFRIVSTLNAHGYLMRDEADKTFRLSRKLLSLGYAAIDEPNLIEKSLDVMRQFRDEVARIVLLGALVDNQRVVLEQVPSTQPVKVLVRIGHHFPLHTAAPLPRRRAAPTGANLRVISCAALPGRQRVSRRTALRRWTATFDHFELG